VELDPANAGYKRDLSVSYERLGDLLTREGERAAARRYYEQALGIRERLVELDPANAGYKIDLVVSLTRAGTPEALERALAILRGLEQEGRLSPRHAAWIAWIEQKLRQGPPTA